MNNMQISGMIIDNGLQWLVHQNLQVSEESVKSCRLTH